jgi:hypothetical protein
LQTLKAGEKATSRARRAVAALIAVGLVLSATASAVDQSAEQPAPLKPLAQGDIEVRVNYVGSLALYSSWLTLRRVGSESSASYRVEASFMAIPQPKNLTRTKPWPDIWKRLETDGFFDLPGNRGAECKGEAVPLDSNWVSVELQRGTVYRKYSYYAPSSLKCGDSGRFLSTLTFLQEAFNRELPVPYNMTRCTPDGKCPDPNTRDAR